MSVYTISSPAVGICGQFLRDAPREHTELYDLEYHLKNGDYFGTLAGALGFIIDEYAERADARSVYHTRLLQKIQHDLASLHKTHTITPKQTPTSPPSD